MRSKKKVDEVYQGRRRREEGPKSASGRTGRQQVAVQILMVCYLAACCLSLLGLLETVRLFSEGSGAADGGSSYILALFALAATVIWAAFTAYMGLSLRSALQRRNFHSLRRRSLTTFLLALLGLVILGASAGANILASLPLGGGAAGLMLFATVSLAAYAGNRSASE